MTLKEYIQQLLLEIKELENEIKELCELMEEKYDLIKMIRKHEAKGDIEELDKEIKQLTETKEECIQRKRTLQKECVTKAFESGYTVTTEDIAIALDSTSDFVTRKLKNDIEHITLPFSCENYIDNFNTFNIVNIASFSKKNILFNRECVIDFFREHIYESTASEGFNYADNSNRKGLTLEEITHFSLRDGKWTCLSREQAEQILNREIDLIKSTTLKSLIYDKLIQNKVTEMERLLVKLAARNESITDEEIEKQKEIIEQYKCECLNPHSKRRLLVHDMQIKRYIKTINPRRFNFIHSGKSLTLHEINL